jgi:hypothetical protein
MDLNYSIGRAGPLLFFIRPNGMNMAGMIPAMITTALIT